jgi:transcriptional regulator with PAS, ATPase and Fis domain
MQSDVEHASKRTNMTPQDLACRVKTTPRFADLLLSQIDDLVYVVDREHRLVFLNNTRQFPQSYNIIGERCYETVMGKSHACDYCPLEDILSGQRVRTSQVIRRGDKQYQVTFSPLICEDGTPLCLHVMRDITEIKQRELRLDTERRLLHSRFRQLEYHHTPLAGLEELIGLSKNWLAVKELIQELARFPTVTVLIVGETGTGKELVAQALHKATYGETASFVPLNCAAIPEHLLESELFGYERGAFTGASHTKKGLFELAHGGTLFLDEIEELSPTLQPKLLRVLETKSFTRLGGTQKIVVDCRLLCATNKPLRAAMAEGKFREDLFHRLSTFTITIPPLRERRDDISLLVDVLIVQANLRLGKRIQGISPEALALLQEYPWPGNVRELKNLIERAVILTEPSGQIEKAAFPPETFPLEPTAGTPILSLKEVERQHLEQTLVRCRGNRSQAAKLLRISRTTLRKKLQDYHLL